MPTLLDLVHTRVPQAASSTSGTELECVKVMSLKRNSLSTSAFTKLIYGGTESDEYSALSIAPCFQMTKIQVRRPTQGHSVDWVQYSAASKDSHILAPELSDSFKDD